MSPPSTSSPRSLYSHLKRLQRTWLCSAVTMKTKVNSFRRKAICPEVEFHQLLSGPDATILHKSQSVAMNTGFMALCKSSLRSFDVSYRTLGRSDVIVASSAASVIASSRAQSHCNRAITIHRVSGGNRQTRAALR
ncbi:hypothetical protein L596_010097 [Steinernema carpocapsae]|uniref:Uncharacterized protein n=1 Tax=Steinernema carpocapsae TaxID=34508 RepID=A0A4V6A6U3_STECR|nr:hypothetical protein L596_010097 [Steinernema carpocapsae]